MKRCIKKFMDKSNTVIKLSKTKSRENILNSMNVINKNFQCKAWSSNPRPPNLQLTSYLVVRNWKLSH
jgi:hypothetical protein